MKKKVLFVLVFLFAFIGGGIAENHKHWRHVSHKFKHRIPIETLIEIEPNDNYLVLKFNYNLYVNTIRISDNLDEEVYNESNMMIEDGETLIVEDTGNFPYMVEIHSAAGSIIGEIIVEDM